MIFHSVFPESVLGSFVFKLLIASFLGGVIGLERDIHGRAAGLRTHLLVSLGSAVFMILSQSLAVSYSAGISDSLLRADPTRIAAQIITGIGFLGAGAIIKSGFSIRGLTTAACLWLSAAIGMSIGAGYYEIGSLTTLIGLFALIVLNRAEKFYSKDTYRSLEITTSIETDMSELINTVKRKYLKILYLDSKRDYTENTAKVYFSIRLRYRDAADKLSHELISDLERSGIKLYRIKWTHR